MQSTQIRCMNALSVTPNIHRNNDLKSTLNLHMKRGNRSASNVNLMQLVSAASGFIHKIFMKVKDIIALNVIIVQHTA